ncbi:translation elongation factor EF1A [Striga asiatica]|uniref:Translation elongation factor EF1A n=1 Tax=Striga asiatica TaxID=4170 RepID=A0A5A7RAR0_STRAF|nr:translation elongation factor EF1A [Striga asiatica]
MDTGKAGSILEGRHRRQRRKSISILEGRFQLSKADGGGGVDEGRSIKEVRLSKKGVTMRCSICKQPNHNSKGCHKNKRNDVPAPVQTESTAKKRKRKSPSKSNFEGNDLQSIRKSPRLKEKSQRVEGEKSIKAGGSSQEPAKKGKHNKVGESSQNPGNGNGKEIVIAGNDGVKANLPVKRSLRLQGLVGEKPQALTQPVRPQGRSSMLDGVRFSTRKRVAYSQD